LAKREEEEYAKFLKKKEELNKTGEYPLNLVDKPISTWDIISSSFIFNIFVGSFIVGCFELLKMLSFYIVQKGWLPNWQ
jgi:hypothetical protein